MLDIEQARRLASRAQADYTAWTQADTPVPGDLLLVAQYEANLAQAHALIALTTQVALISSLLSTLTELAKL